MDNVIDKIVNLKKSELLIEKQQQTIADLEKIIQTLSEPKGFVSSLKKKPISIIGELKKASPSKGVIVEDFAPQALAMQLEQAGAAALSVLTEKNFFLGSLEYLKEVRELVQIPLLRKDFIFDEYQIYQARAYGADAILLIARMLDRKQFQFLYDTAKKLHLDVLSEAHTLEEVQMLEDLNVEMIGVNARNLKTFETDMSLSLSLMKAIDNQRVKVAESAIRSYEDIQKFQAQGVNVFLIGETLMRAESIPNKMKELLYGQG